MPNGASSSVDTAAARVILHIDARYHTRYRQAHHLAIFPVIEDIIAARGGQVVIAPRLTEADLANLRWGDGDLHIVQGGSARGVGFLNAGLAYLSGYWHLDAQGVLAESSAPLRGFDPNLVNTIHAQDFLEKLHRDFVLPRASRYKQAKPVTELPRGAIAVFLQGPTPGTKGQNYIGQRAMLRAAIAAASGRPVLVKAHPLRLSHGRELMHDLRSEGLQFTEVEANVHDLLSCCDVTVSINSAAAIEGFLHGKPAILCGRSDFASQVETVREAKYFPAALQAALSRPRNYAPWLHWYFTQFCIDISAQSAAARILAAFAEAGFNAARLGLTEL